MCVLCVFLNLFHALTHSLARFLLLDYAERHGYTKGVVKEIIHDPGRGAPVAKIQFKDPYRFKRINTTIVAPEGMHTGQFVYAGKKGRWWVGGGGERGLCYSVVLFIYYCVFVYCVVYSLSLLILLFFLILILN